MEKYIKEQFSYTPLLFPVVDNLEWSLILEIFQVVQAFD